MRLSPRSIFFGIVALGLPFAVTVGWMLGGSAAKPPPAAAPAGAGSLGAAPSPAPTAGDEPITPVDYGSRPPRATVAAPSRSAPVTRLPSSSAPGGLPQLSLAPLPPLTDPPVPTPTMVTSAPPPPSATPSGSATPAPTGMGLIR